MARKIGSGSGEEDHSSLENQLANPSVLSKNHAYNLNAKYSLGRELGEGHFGITYLVTDKETQEVFARKSISKMTLMTADQEEDVRREVAVMQHLPKHPNIVALNAAYEDDDAMHLVMELCEGGELYDRIATRTHASNLYTEREAATLIRTIMEVVQMCHKHGVMHRDLKPENFLFVNEKENSPLKAIDFGLALFFKPGEKFTEIKGSPRYIAPEMWLRNYGPEVDVWSAGVILYMMLSGTSPFVGKTNQVLAQRIVHGVVDLERNPWPQVSDSAKSLVRHMLEWDPKARYNAEQVLNHPWLQAEECFENIESLPSVNLCQCVDIVC